MNFESSETVALLTAPDVPLLPPAPARARTTRSWLALATPLALGVAAAPLLSAVRAAEHVVQRRRARIGGLVGFLAGLGAVGLARWQLSRWFTEQPRYETEGYLGALEIRRYPAMLLAETRAPHSDFERALDLGFRRLATYLGGENKGHSEIAMTTPVLARRDGDGHVVTFVMPGPSAEPLDPEIVLRSADARRFAVRRHRGDYSAKHVRAMQEELVHEILLLGLTPIGEPMFAGYDPPSTIPALRRVEIWVEIT